MKTRIGKNMKHCLNFYQQYPGWYPFDKKDRGTKNAIKRLNELNLIKIGANNTCAIINNTDTKQKI